MSEQQKVNGGNGDSTAVTVSYIQSAAQLPAEWTAERILSVARTVAPEEASASDIAMFLAVAQAYELDPFLKEIWLAKDKGKIIILTGRDAIVKVARRDPKYRGYRSGVVYQKDKFVVEHTDAGVQIAHTINGFDRGELIGAYCVVFKEDHPPVLVMRRLDDYKHLSAGKDNWKNYPADMLETRVITAAHRRAFHISGLYAPEEFVDGELDDEVKRDSARAHAGTKDRLADLKARMGAPPQTLSAEPVGEQHVQDADFEVMQDPTPTAEASAAAAEQGRQIREDVEAELPDLKPIDTTLPLSVAGLSGRARGALERSKVYTVAQLLTLTWAQLEETPGIGKSARDEIDSFLAKNKLTLAQPAAPTTEQVVEAGAEDEHERAMRRFWAVYHDAGLDSRNMDQERARREWLRATFGQDSLARLTTEQLVKAGMLIEAGDRPGTKPAQAPAAAAPSSAPVREAQGSGGLPW